MMTEIRIIESLKTRETKAKLIKIFIMYLYLPLGVLVALLTPDNILDYRWARVYTDFMASWLPYVAEVGRWTKVPATQFIGAVMNLVAIMCSISLIYVQLKYYLEEIIKRMKELPPKKQIAMLFTGLPLFTFGSYLILFLNPIDNPPGYRDRIMIGSNLGMGLYGSLDIACGWLGIALVVIGTISVFVLIKRCFAVKGS